MGWPKGKRDYICSAGRLFNNYGACNYYLTPRHVVDRDQAPIILVLAAALGAAVSPKVAVRALQLAPAERAVRVLDKDPAVSVADIRVSGGAASVDEFPTFLKLCNPNSPVGSIEVSWDDRAVGRVALADTEAFAEGRAFAVPEDAWSPFDERSVGLGHDGRVDSLDAVEQRDGLPIEVRDSPRADEHDEGEKHGELGLHVCPVRNISTVPTGLKKICSLERVD